MDIKNELINILTMHYCRILDDEVLVKINNLYKLNACDDKNISEVLWKYDIALGKFQNAFIDDLKKLCGYDVCVDNELDKKVDFNKLYFGNFEPSSRELKIIEKLSQYYEDTPDSMDNREALKYWNDFKKWCYENNYSNEDITRAKKQHRKY